MRNEDPIPALKRQMDDELARIIEGWGTHDIAAMLNTDRPRIADIRRGRLDRFSLETLIRLATRARKQVPAARAWAILPASSAVLPPVA